MVVHSGLPDFDCSIAILGASGVGKTALLRSLFQQVFPEKHEPTVDEYFMHTIAVRHGVTRNLRIVDTGGTHVFPVMRRFAIDACEGFVIVYSLDNPQSFEEAIRLLDEVISLRKAKDSRKIPVFLVANKLDIGGDQREAYASRSAEELHSRADHITSTYIEISLKRGSPVETGIFHSLVKIITEAERKRSKLKSSVISLRESVRKTTRCLKDKKKRRNFRAFPRIFAQRKIGNTRLARVSGAIMGTT